MTAARFYGDWAPTITYAATGFDADWNGFAAPIVSRTTFQRLLRDSPGYSARARPTATGDFAWLVDRAEPDENGDTVVTHYAVIPVSVRGYHLRNLGWTFDYVEEGADAGPTD